MFGLSKKHEEIVLPVPYIYPEHVEGKVQVFEQFQGNYPISCKQEDIQELVDCIPIAQQKGMSKQADILKRRAIAGFLEMRGMALIYSERQYYGSGDFMMSRFGHDGKVKYVHPTEKREEYSVIDLKSFDGAIPTELIRNVPQEIADNVKILYTKYDPIAFVPLTTQRDGKWWGVAIYCW